MIIRNFEPDDLNNLAAIHSASKQVAEKGIIYDEDLAIFSPEYYQDKWRQWSQAEDTSIVIAYDEDNSAMGFVSFGRIKTRPDFDRGVVPKFGGEIYALYIHPDYFHKRVGTALFKKACENLAEKKLTSMILWAMKKNKRACAFYDKMGGERVGKKRIEIGEKSYADESCFAWKDVRKIF